MNMQILALVIVVVSFAALFTWVFLPRNRARYEAQAKLIIEPEDADQGEQS